MNPSFHQQTPRLVRVPSVFSSPPPAEDPAQDAMPLPAARRTPDSGPSDAPLNPIIVHLQSLHVQVGQLISEHVEKDKEIAKLATTNHEWQKKYDKLERESRWRIEGLEKEVEAGRERINELERTNSYLQQST